MITHQQTIKKTTFEKIQKDPSYWYFLVNRLNTGDVYDHIPANYYNQEMMVKSYVYQYYGDYEGGITDFKILSQKTISKENQSFQVYEYELSVKNTDRIYLGVCSQPGELKHFSLKPTYFKEGEVDQEGEKSAMLKDLLSEMDLE